MPSDTVKDIRARLLGLPVAINNYYGDPLFQWDDTLAKIDRLLEDGHSGVIALLTRGLVSRSRAQELANRGYDRLVVIPPLSHLGSDIEIQNHEERYQTISNLVDAGVRVIPNIRPVIQGRNDHLVFYMIRRAREAGANTLICSGIRGDDEILSRTLTPEETEKYCLRLKLMPQSIGATLAEAVQTLGVSIAKRVSCGIAIELGEPSHNPYWKSPLLAGCSTCPVRALCESRDISSRSDLDAAGEFLDALGYEWRILPDDDVCSVTPANRRDCPACCTACYTHGHNTILVDTKPMSLGTLSFLRFIFPGVTFTHPGIRDMGLRDTSRVYIPALSVDQLPGGRYPEAINTWYVIARQIDKCYECKFCIVDAYRSAPGEHGVFPMDLYHALEGVVA